MIRKIVFCMLAIAFIFSATFVCAKKNDEKVSSEQKEMTKEERKAKKRLEKEKKKAEKEKQKQEKKLKEQKEEKKGAQEEAKQKAEKESKKKAKEEQKKLEKEKKKAEKEHKKKEEEQKRLEQEKKKEAEEKLKKEEKAKKEAKEAEDRKIKNARKEEAKKQNFWNKMIRSEKTMKAKEEKMQIKSTERMQAAKAREERYLNSLERKNLAAEKRKIRAEKLLVDKNLAKVEREKMMIINKDVRRRDAQADYAQGFYSDLYKRPAWPFEMFYSDKKDIFQVAMKYDYATDAYTSGGSTSDLTALTFGEQSFEFQDLLLAVKMYHKGFLSLKRSIYDAGADRLFDVFYNKKLIFYGESNEFDVSLDFARYIWDKNVLLGVRVPVGYRAHKLKLDSDIKAYEFINNGFYQGSADWETLLAELLNYAIAPKNLSYLPKSSITGLGDISTFLNVQFQTRYVEKFLIGLDVIWPTAKGADIGKLWAPKLGNDFTQVALFASVLFNHQKRCFNPHMFLRGVYQVQGHKDRRVPKIISHTKNNATDVVGPDVMAHGELVHYIGNVFFTEPDTTVPAFADNVESVEIRPGPEVELRIGNIWEKFIWRRAFLDIFYNFRAKWRDHIGNSDLPRDIWDADILKYQTHQLEHKLGLDLTYQIDAQSRLQAGFNWVFAGINVPMTLEGTFAVNVEF